MVRGEQEQALAIIKENPDVLMYRSEAIDYSGRTIRGTAFQAALGAGDKPMWEMMLPYFKSLEQEEALRQFNEQFPNGIEETPASELKADYNVLNGNFDEFNQYRMQQQTKKRYPYANTIAAIDWPIAA